MKKSRRTYNGVHLNKKSNTQDVVEQSLTINLILTKYTTVGKSNRQDFKQTLIKKCKHIEQGNYQYLLTALGLYKKEIKPYPQPEKFEIIL